MDLHAWIEGIIRPCKSKGMVTATSTFCATVLSELRSLHAEVAALRNEVKMQGRSRARDSAVDVTSSKRMRLRLVQLPKDVVGRILRHVSVPDIRSSQLVCTTWRRAVVANAVELWKTRCKAMEFLPPAGTDTVLRRSAARLRLYIDKACRYVKRRGTEKHLAQKKADLYSPHVTFAARASRTTCRL